MASFTSEVTQRCCSKANCASDILIASSDNAFASEAYCWATLAVSSAVIPCELRSLSYSSFRLLTRFFWMENWLLSPFNSSVSLV